MSKHDNVWGCKIGFADFDKLPMGADGPMREAVARAFKEITGHEPDFVLSGWSWRLTKVERQVVATAYESESPDA